MFTVSVQNWIDDVLSVNYTEFETLAQAHEYASEQQALGLQSKIFNEATTLPVSYTHLTLPTKRIV